MTWQRTITDLLVAPPMVYDLVQQVAGGDEVKRYLQRHVSGVGSTRDLLDVGGGTGLYRDLWPEGWTYTCLDNDPEKLCGFRQRFPQDEAILGDAVVLPLADASLDVMFCSNVSHHLTDEQRKSFIHECAGVLRTDGSFVLFDALWSPGRVIARTLWNLDRRAYPRRRERMLSALDLSFDLKQVERLAIPLR